ncbi:hypothetical protein Pcinc_016140 [Petrolisthes cinctipes]|uniref:Sequestosome-1 n=1 Tax=Petrolisthes cinctipes TaxID=88211 RepID=A0AAE1KRB4_PETCI|nr:hypothetical protein Pcinc_016140 [Petrolisthes cinctipes]
MSVKVYMDVGGGVQEVRRFGMPEALATNYTCLKDKIRSVFALGNQDITVSWKDADGDTIVISSDDELMEAIADNMSKQNLNLLRISVTVNTQSRPASRNSNASGGNVTPGNQQGEVHPGITCDGCEGEVRGFRYRCVSCPDYDLCGACETRGLHPEHKMMRLPKPHARGDPSFFWRENEGPPGHFSTHFGMHNNGQNGTSFSSTSTGGGCGSGSGVGGAWGWGGGFGPHGRCHRRGRGRGGWNGWWGKPWGGKNFWGQSMSTSGQQQRQQQQQQGQQQQQQGQQQEQQQQQQQQQHHQQQQSKSKNDEGEKCPWTSTANGSCPFMEEGGDIPSPQQVAEEAQQMAEEVAHHAHHFASHMASEQVANVMRGIWTAWTGQHNQGQGQGINTTTFSSSSSSSSSKSQENQQQEQNQSVDGEGSMQNNSNQNSSGTPGEEYLKNVGESVASMLDPLGIDVEVSVEHNGIRQRCSLGENDSPGRQIPVVTLPPSPPPEASSQPSSANSVNMEVQTEEPTNSQNSAAVSESMDVGSPAPGPSQVSGAGDQIESDHTGSPEPDDWTLVNKDIPQEQSKASAKPRTPPPQRVQYPNLTELTPHPDPVIQRALEQMQAMGYNNENGWLSNLLEMKGGDINQVLDLLQPVSK